jgi:hypothetical protein
MDEYASEFSLRSEYHGLLPAQVNENVIFEIHPVSMFEYVIIAKS